MDINANATSLYGQYQGLVDRFKSGAVTYQEAFAEHTEMAPQTRELIGTGVLTGALEGGPIKVNISAEAIDKIEAYLAANDGGTVSEHSHAAQTYTSNASGNAQRAENDARHTTWTVSQGFVPLTPTSIADLTVNDQVGYMADIRHDFNTEAFDHLSTYANENKSEWMAAAQELGISAEGGMFLEHFFRIPPNSGVDVSTGTPNSDAERIFRHIASAEDVAQFDNLMAPKQQELETRTVERVSGLLEWTNDEMVKFSSHRTTLEAAGLTSVDMAGVTLNRGEDGRYIVTSQSDKAATIANTINTNSELRAIYDAAWTRGGLRS